MKKRKRAIYSLYRSAFFQSLKNLTYKGRSPLTRLECLFSYLTARMRQIKRLRACILKNDHLKSEYPYLVYSLYKCKLPIYLSIKSNKIIIKKSSYCSDKLCTYCWVRSMCKPIAKTIKGLPKIDNYVLAYKSTVKTIPYDSSQDDIARLGLAEFSKRHIYKKSSLESKRISGICEQLCVYPDKEPDTNVPVIKLELRQLAYCHADSTFAKASLCVSKNICSNPVINFCAYPINLTLGRPEVVLNIRSAFKGSRLFRKYGAMVIKSGDVSK